MTLNLTAIREGLAGTLRATVDRETNVLPYDPFGSPAYPRIVILPAPGYVDFTVAQSSGVTDVRLIVSIQVVAADGINEGRLIDEYLSRGVGQNSSVMDAIDADPTLGGLVSYCIPQSVDPVADERCTRADLLLVLGVDDL